MATWSSATCENMLRSTATNLHKLSPSQTIAGQLDKPSLQLDNWTIGIAAMEPDPAEVIRGPKDYKLDNVMDPIKIMNKTTNGICRLPGLKLVIYGSGHEYEDVTRGNGVSVASVIWFGTDSNQCELFFWISGLQKKILTSMWLIWKRVLHEFISLFACMYDSSKTWLFRQWMLKSQCLWAVPHQVSTYSFMPQSHWNHQQIVLPPLKQKRITIMLKRC